MARKEIESPAEDRAEGYVEEPGERRTKMAKGGKSKSRSSPTFAKGGNASMLGQQYAGPQKPGVTSHEITGNGGDWAKGGSGHMVGQQTASPAKPA